MSMPQLAHQRNTGDPDYDSWMKACHLFLSALFLFAAILLLFVIALVVASTRLTTQRTAEAGVVDSTGNPVSMNSLTTVSQVALPPFALTPAPSTGIVQMGQGATNPLLTLAHTASGHNAGAGAAAATASAAAAASAAGSSNAPTTAAAAPSAASAAAAPAPSASVAPSQPATRSGSPVPNAAQPPSLMHSPGLSLSQSAAGAAAVAAAASTLATAGAASASTAGAGPNGSMQQQLQDMLRPKRQREVIFPSRPALLCLFGVWCVICAWIVYQFFSRLLVVLTCGLQEEVAGAMVALRRASSAPGAPLASQFITPLYRDMLRQVMQELRTDETFGTLAGPGTSVVASDDVNILNTPRRSAGRATAAAMCWRTAV